MSFNFFAIYRMKIGTKEMIAIVAILVILFMSFQGSQEKQVIVLDRQPEYIPTPVFVGPRPRRRRPRYRHYHPGPKVIPIKPIKEMANPVEKTSGKTRMTTPAKIQILLFFNNCIMRHGFQIILAAEKSVSTPATGKAGSEQLIRWSWKSSPDPPPRRPG